MGRRALPSFTSLPEYRLIGNNIIKPSVAGRTSRAALFSDLVLPSASAA
jgi:hypothetical protein